MHRCGRLPRGPLALAAGAALVLAVYPARGADTVEPWDVGATDVDFYLGAAGIGAPRDGLELSGEIMLGYGLIERLSAYLGASLAADGCFCARSHEVFLGLFGTPVDTRHVDLDLFLDLSSSAAELTDFGLGPGIELNLDVDPDRGSWGTYVRTGLSLSGREVIDQEGEETTEMTASVDAVFGTYYTIARRHQILVEYDMTFRLRPRGDERDVEVGGVALGYNVVLCDAIELITEARLDVPQGDEAWSVGFVAGLIATLPSAGRRADEGSATEPPPEEDEAEGSDGQR